LDYDTLEENHVCTDIGGGESPASDWDSDNDCILDDDDKATTYITLNLPENLWLDALKPAVFRGKVEWFNITTGFVENASLLPVQVHIEWANNGTTA